MKIKRLSESERKEGKRFFKNISPSRARSTPLQNKKNTYANPFAIAIDLGTLKFQPPDGVEGTEQDVMRPALCWSRRGKEEKDKKKQIEGAEEKRILISSHLCRRWCKPSNSYCWHCLRRICEVGFGGAGGHDG